MKVHDGDELILGALLAMTYQFGSGRNLWEDPIWTVQVATKFEPLQEMIEGKSIRHEKLNLTQRMPYHDR